MQNLLYIGYPKCGSTFLRKWFYHHPQLHYQDEGFGGFKGTPSISQMAWENPDYQPKYYVTGEEEYAFWNGPVDLLGFQLLDYPVKPHQTKVCETLKHLFPNAKVLIITRGFESVIRSAYSQYTRLGGNLKFRDFLKKNQDRIVEFWDYQFLINLYGDAFGQENLVIVPFELLSQDPNAFLRCLEKKLDLRTVPFDVSKVNFSISPQQMYWYHFLSNKVLGSIQIFSGERQRILYQWYRDKLYQGKWLLLVDFFIRFFPDRRMDLSWEESVLQRLAGKADVIKDRPEFRDFLKHYLVIE